MNAWTSEGVYFSPQPHNAEYALYNDLRVGLSDHVKGEPPDYFLAKYTLALR